MAEDARKYKETRVTLLFLSALATFSALVFWVRHAGIDGQDPKASAFKTASTAALVVLGAVTGAPGLIVAGLALGSVGDYALSRDGKPSFLIGMAAFALGHLAYAVAFARNSTVDVSVLPLAFWLTLALMTALTLLTALWIAPKAGGLAWPVRGYALVIGAMALAATLMPETPGRAITQIGVALFVASDLILAIRLFVLRDRALRLFAARALWPLYWLGQALILWGSYA